jgi:uncharacterized protein YyaL (SSP411 family)
MSRNLLDQETSPYLLLHRDNPVHWRPWGAEALAEAEATGKPILLSIGYTACHWCHVMNEESFSDPETAALMNDNFINIKVDREERPDIDQVYQTATAGFGLSGGWPLTAFLTPRGELFHSGTYFPKEDRPGAIGLKSALATISKTYHEHPNSVRETAAKINTHLSNLWSRNLKGDIGYLPIDQAAIRVAQRFDIFFGGMLGAPKFPTMPLVEMLHRAYLRSGVSQFALVSQTTLGHIIMGGIYDHLGGGFSRYATDERWIQPHFEKMLYDNAQIVDMLTLAWQQDRNPVYRLRIEETIDWVLRDMMVEQGFASSIDADSEGEEGKYYLWTEAEIDAVLAGTFAQKFKQVYGVTHEGNLNGRNVLHRSNPGSEFGASQADEALLKKQRELLLAARLRRVPPLRDDKVQADWNGMMIAALANAGVTFRKTAWTTAAIRAFQFIENILGDGDRLYHSWREGKRQHIGFAEDYAHMARAAFTLWESTNDKRYLKKVEAWVRVLNEHFWDNQNGGYFQTADDSDPLIIRARSVMDQFIPSANGILPALLSRLYLATQQHAYRNNCNALIDAFSGEVGRAYLSMGSFMNSLETVTAGLLIVIVGPVTNPKTHELASAVMGRSLPTRLLVTVDPSESLPEGHPAFGAAMAGGVPTAYICRGPRVEAPITNPVTLSQALQFPQVPAPQKAMLQPVGRA